MLSLDTTTRAEYDAAVTAAAKAQTVLAALGNTVTVAVYDGSNTLMGSGLMQSPWATRSANVLTVGEVGSFAVTTNGTPDASWYLRFEGNSRWLRGSFGLTGSGADFTWSLPTWSTSQTGALGTITATSATYPLERDIAATYNVAAGAVITFGWTVPEGYGITLPSSGGNYDLAQHLARPQGITPTYTLTTPITGVSVSASTGVLLVAPGTAAGVYNATVVADDGVIVVQSADRDATPYLFQQAPPPEASRLAGGLDFYYDTGGGSSESSRQGVNARWVDYHTGWMWTTPGGDWIDGAQASNGTTPWATAATNSVVGPVSVNITTALQNVQQNNRWAAFCLTSGNAILTINSRTNADPAKRPRITGTYTDGSSFTLNCWLSAQVSANLSDAPSQRVDPIALPLTTDTKRVFVEFDRPTKPVQSATLNLTVVQVFSGSDSRIRLRGILTPPTRNAATLTGAATAAGGTFDAGLVGNSNVIWLHRYLDGSAQTDFVSTYWGSLVDSEYSPEFWGGAVNTGKLPHIHAGKFIQANNPAPSFPTTQQNLTLVNSSYTGEGFAPLAPGLGALRTHCTAKPANDGDNQTNNGGQFCNARLLLPAARLGLQRHIRIRYYQRIHLSPLYNPMTPQNRKHIYSSGATRWTDRSGKGGFGPNHDTREGGVSGSSGGTKGWQMRDSWYLCDANVGGPNETGVAYGYHLYDYLGNNPVGHRYGQNEHGLGERYGQRGGYGGIFQYDRWYLIEKEIYLNTVAGVTAPAYIADGYLRTWIDGRLVFESTGMVFRQLPYTTSYTQGSNWVTPIRELGVREVWLNCFYGGQSDPTENVTHFYTGLVVADGALGYIGPMVGA